MRKLIAIAFVLCVTSAIAQEPINPSAVNGRLESLSASLNAVANECANRAGSMLQQATDAITKLQKEIEQLKDQLKPKEPK